MYLFKILLGQLRHQWRLFTENIGYVWKNSGILTIGSNGAASILYFRSTAMADGANETLMLGYFPIFYGMTNY